MKRYYPGLLAVVALACSCASTPRVGGTYYFPTAGTQASITQVLSCMVNPSDQSTVVQSTSTVNVSTMYKSDLKAAPGSIGYAAADGPITDTDLALSWTDDGRLSSVNDSATGEAGTVIKNAISFAAAVAPAAIAAAEGQIGAPPPPQTTSPTQKACNVIKSYFSGDASKGAPSVTLTYNVAFSYGSPSANGATPLASNASGDLMIMVDSANSASSLVPSDLRRTIAISPDPGSSALYAKLRSIYGPAFAFRVVINNSHAIEPVTWDASTAGAGSMATLTLNRVAMADLEVDGPTGDLSKSLPIWKGEFQIPVAGRYLLPIPKAPLFGKTQFALTLAASGAISKLEYNKTSGASDASASAASLAKALTGPPAQTDTAKAAEVQAKADMIYETNRLAVCQATPSSCPSK